MAMPSSGNIAILCNTLQACSSISCAVDGNNTPPKNLTTLSTTAGKTAPHCMREFYGYEPPPDEIYVNFNIFCCYDSFYLSRRCACLVTSESVPLGDCYYPKYYWSFGGVSNGGQPVVFCTQIWCNSTSIYNCSISTTSSVFCSGNFINTTTTKVDCDDTITVKAEINVFGAGDYGEADFRFDNICSCEGCYIDCSPNSIHPTVGGP